MNKDEKSLMDEIWEAAGLNSEEQAPKAEEAKAEEPVKEEQPAVEEPKVAEPAVEEPKVTEPAVEEPKAAEPTPESVKKKDIKFLVLYTTVSVIVISALIGGSYLITSRIHHQMSQNNDHLNHSQSTLKNIQDENTALKAENAALKESNLSLTASQQEAEELLNSVGDMVEHDGYLAAAQSAYIDGKKADAKELFGAIDRAKLSIPNQACYDLLKDKLGL
jgi:hypothetical protein